MNNLGLESKQNQKKIYSECFEKTSDHAVDIFPRTKTWKVIWEDIQATVKPVESCFKIFGRV